MLLNILTDDVVLKIIGWTITGLIALVTALLTGIISYGKKEWKNHKAEEHTRWSLQEKKEKERDVIMDQRFCELSKEFKEMNDIFRVRNEMFFEEHNLLKGDVSILHKRVNKHDVDIKELKKTKK